MTTRWLSTAVAATLLAAPTAAWAAPAAQAITQYQAESATISQGVVESDHAGYTGSGFVNYDNETGGYVEFGVSAPAAGTATLTFRYANGTTVDRPLSVAVGGRTATVAFPGTGAWTTWRTATATVTLAAGANRVRATATTSNGGPNLDRLDVATGDGAPDTRAPSVPQDLRATATTSTGVGLAWTASTDDVGVTGYEVRGGSSTVFVPAAGTTVSGLSPATSYTFSVRAKDAAGNLSAWSAPVTATTKPAGGGRPADVNGRLHVCGVKLCNQYGHPIQLRGMSTHGIQWYAQCVKTASLDALAGDWGADVLRISMYIQEDGYETNPRKFTDLVHGYIEEATKRGMYALVDWHQLTPGDPNYNLSRAKTFFTEIAQRHKDKTNIIYDIANEPNGVPWAKVKSYAEQVIPVIRAQDPDGVVFVGTHGWSSLGVSDGRTEADILANPVDATNLMYTFHFYAASHHDEYFAALQRAAARIPLFVTEFGTQDYEGDGADDFAYSQKYLDFLAANKIGWTNWNFSDDRRSGAVFKAGTCAGGAFTGTGVLKPAGVWIRERVRTPDDFPTG